MSSQPDIRFAVLGPISRGIISLLAHRPEQGFHLTALCGLHLHLQDLSRYEAVLGGNFTKTTNYQEILDNPDIDGVFVCTPDHLHAEHAIAALNAGKHVFLEKPMATSIEDCDRILAAGQRSKGKLYVGHNMRFFPVMRKMRELILGGRIGRVEAVWCRHFISYGGDAYFKDWHSERKYVNSLLLQKGAHDIDIIHWLAGGHTRRVVGMGKLSVYSEVTDRRSPDHEPLPGREKRDMANWPPLSQKGLSPVIDVEDHEMLLLQLSNGVQASYSQCQYTPDGQRNYTVIGTEGRIENFGHASSQHKWATVHLWNQRTGYNEMGHEVFRIPHITGSHGGADPLMVQDFLNVLRGKPSEGASVFDARMSVAAGIKGAESLRDNSIPRDIAPPAP